MKNTIKLTIVTVFFLFFSIFYMVSNKFPTLLIAGVLGIIYSLFFFVYSYLIKEDLKIAPFAPLWRLLGIGILFLSFEIFMVFFNQLVLAKVFEVASIILLIFGLVILIPKAYKELNKKKIRR